MIVQPQRIMEEVRHIPRVNDVLARINFSGLANNGRADLPIIGEGVEPAKEKRLGTAMTIIAGSRLWESDAYGAIVGEGVATALQLKPGSFLTLMVNTSEGALNTLEFKVEGVFRTFSKDYDDRAVRIPLAAAQGLLVTHSVHSLVVSLDNTRATGKVTAEVKKLLRNQGYEIKPWYQLADFYNKTVALYKRQFGVLQFIILVMLVLSVASTVNMAVYERTGEFGTMLAIGQRRHRIFSLIVLENTLLGLIGSLIGVAIGCSLAVVISGIGIQMPPPPGSSVGYVASIRLVPWILMAALFIGMVSAALAAILPGRRAARLQVVEALRYNI
jgi:putative ABC transport system permease protein